MLPTVHGENEFSDADVVGFIMYDPPALQLLELKGQQLPDRVHPLVHCAGQYMITPISLSALDRTV
jgi:hypothetical protein